jgi:hypothetical protein
MTVGDVIEKMTGHELMGWKLFEDEFGPLNIGLRFDAAIARAVHPFLKSGTPIEALMPWPKKIDSGEEAPSDIRDAFKLLTSASKATKAKGNTLNG